MAYLYKEQSHRVVHIDLHPKTVWNFRKNLTSYTTGNVNTAADQHPDMVDRSTTHDDIFVITGVRAKGRVGCTETQVNLYDGDPGSGGTLVWSCEVTENIGLVEQVHIPMTKKLDPWWETVDNGNAAPVCDVDLRIEGRVMMAATTKA